MDPGTLKPIRWIGSSLKDLKSFPAKVRSDVGFALYAAQNGPVKELDLIRQRLATAEKDYKQRPQSK